MYNSTQVKLKQRVIMRKIVTLFLTTVFLLASEFSISSIDDNIVTFDCNGVQKYQSGNIFREINGYKVIIKSAIIIDDKSCKAKVSDSSALKQDALPQIVESVKIGDKISFDTFSKKALLIAPNSKSYDREISESYNLEFVNSDIFATFMKSKDKLAPESEDFKEFCESLSIGTLIILAQERHYTLDCLSFKILQQKNIDNYDSKESITPFYNRIGHLKGSILNFESKIEYDKYYTKLLSY